MNPSFKKAILYLLIAYLVTTFFGALLSVVLGYALGLPSYVEAGVKPSQSPAYKVTESFHPLLCLIFYTLFAYLHLHGIRAGRLNNETSCLATFGAIGSMLVDFISFVLIPHPFAFTLQEFYLDYQPWISLTYVMIFLSPWLARRALRNVPISS